MVPVPQDDGPFPVVAIAYSDKAKEAFGLLRAVMAANELSERALDVTAAVIDVNAANYVAWFWRRKCLDALKMDLFSELAYVAEVAEENPKNYQIWHHRRAVVEMIGDGCLELAFTAAALSEEPKNYHAWSHRQWAVQAFKLWDRELDYSASLLSEDPLNNSAWNYRHFVIANTTKFTPVVVDREVEYVLSCVTPAVDNASAWAYLKGIAKHADEASLRALLARVDAIIAGAASGEAGAALSTVEPLDCKLFLVRKLGAAPEEVRLLCDQLSAVDPIRKRYWQNLHVSPPAAVAGGSASLPGLGEVSATAS